MSAVAARASSPRRGATARHVARDRRARARARALGRSGRATAGLDAYRLDAAVRGQRDDDAAPARHRRRALRPPSVRATAAHHWLFDAALFTAKEAAVGFAIGAAIGFLLGALIAQFAVLQRGVMPYIVASQTIPILAIAPIVVVGLGSVQIFGWTPTDWVRVVGDRGVPDVLPRHGEHRPRAALCGSGRGRADGSYAAREWAVFWKLRVPAALPFLFSAFKVAATACVVGAMIGELPSSIQGGLGRRDPELQPVLLARRRRTSGRRT